jgi:hypothetical protein
MFCGFFSPIWPKLLRNIKDTWFIKDSRVSPYLNNIPWKGTVDVGGTIIEQFYWKGGIASCLLFAQSCIRALDVYLEQVVPPVESESGRTSSAFEQSGNGMQSREALASGPTGFEGVEQIEQ